MNKKLSSLIIIAALGLSACSQKESDVIVEPSKPIVEAPQKTDNDASKVTVVDIKPIVKPDLVTMDYVENVHYRIVKDINVEGLTPPFLVEYFWLGCPHCQTFEPLLKSFKAKNPDVQILKKHAVMSPRWAKDARIFYALKEMKKMEHFDDLFNLYKIKELPTKLDIEEFLTLKNINKEEFFKLADKSETILKSIEESLREMVNNKITGVPAIVVNGKYFLLPSKDIVSVEDYFKLVEHLLSK
jgi:thiol:disulfide interchange protein DsbA